MPPPWSLIKQIKLKRGSFLTYITSKRVFPVDMQKKKKKNTKIQFNPRQPFMSTLMLFCDEDLIHIILEEENPNTPPNTY